MVEKSTVTKKVPQARKGFPTFDQVYVSNPYNIKQVNMPTYRYYDCDGLALPSITTVLGRHPSSVWVQEWRDRVGEEFADKVSRKAAAIGTSVHNLAELYLANKITNKDIMQALPEARVRFAALRKFLDDIEVVYFQERAVYSKVLGIAGTLDCLAIYKGKLTVIDFKTASGLRTEEEIQGYFAQVTMYGMALMELYPDIVTEMPQICIAIAVNNKSEPQVFVKKGLEDIKNRLTYVKQCVIIYNNEQEHEA